MNPMFDLKDYAVQIGKAFLGLVLVACACGVFLSVVVFFVFMTQR